MALIVAQPSDKGSMGIPRIACTQSAGARRVAAPLSRQTGGHEVNECAQGDGRRWRSERSDNGLSRRGLLGGPVGAEEKERQAEVVYQRRKRSDAYLTVGYDNAQGSELATGQTGTKGR